MMSEEDIYVDIRNKENETLKDLDKYLKTIGTGGEVQIKDDHFLTKSDANRKLFHSVVVQKRTKGVAVAGGVLINPR